MAIIKNYTDIFQSQKLTEFLSIESADMVYIWHATRYDKDMPPMVLGDVPINKIYADTLACWSLAALLDIIPKRIKDYNVLRIDITENDFAIWYDEISSGVNNDLPDITMESAIDACYELILKLYELKLL